MKKFIQTVLCTCVLSTLALPAQAQSTAFTYQGRLNDGAIPANGKYDLTFALFSVVSGAGQVGSILTNSTTGVSNGLFTVTLDFGNQFPGANRWLEIGVRTNSGGAFTTLAPRQPLTPAPYAIYAANAAQVGGQGATAFVAKAGDTMTGTLNLPANGLTVGTSQLVASGGKVTLGGALVVDNLDLNSGVFNPGVTFGFGSGEGIASKRNSGGNQFGLDLYTAGIARLSIAFGGNVGIGTTTPDRPLVVKANGSSELMSLKDNTGATRWHLNLQSGGLNFAQSTVADGRLFLGTNGNVGIGTLEPGAALDVAGAIRTLSGGIVFPDGSIQTQAAGGSTPPPGMALIPAGSFTMGNSIGDGDITDATPISTKVSAFYMDVNLVSWSQWQSVYYWATNHGYTFVHAGSGKAANHPVQLVDWYDCVKWCNARSQQAGRTPVYYTDAGLKEVYTNGAVMNPYPNWAASGYRLPTEAEWEKAARGGLSGQRFPWGNVINQNLANYSANTGISFDLGPNGYNPIGNYPTTTPGTSPVGSFAANVYGLNDMAGNVSEWCWDWYGATYAGGSDPHGPIVGGLNDERVVRGGSWGFSAGYARCADRAHAGPFGFSNGIGFRCVRGL